MVHRVPEFFAALGRAPVVAAVRRPGEFEAALAKGVEVIFILGEDIFYLREAAKDGRRRGKLVLAHIDLIKGVGKDEAGVRLLKEVWGVEGILSTRGNLIASARKEGLIGVQRLFLLDSDSLEVGLATILKTVPDAFEILPGIIFPKIADRLRDPVLPRVLAGGLIRRPAEVDEILAAGALAVSASTQALWGYAPARRDAGAA
jgi:glycerol uptake operon antiterminator